MPIKPENRDRYPADWLEIRVRILDRANHCCERCRVPNHALGGRTPDGQFHRALPLGEKNLCIEWPAPGEDAFCAVPAGTERLRIIRIVLTIAHLDHQPENCADDNLQALCQRCHLAHDREHHARNSYATRRAGKAAADLFDGEGRE